MTAVVAYAQKLTGTAANPSVATMTAPTVGDTVLVLIAVPTANAPLTGFTDNLGNTYTADQTVTGINGLTYYLYRKSNIGNAPTTLSATFTSGSYASYFEVLHVQGLDNASPLESLISGVLSGGASQANHVASFTTASANAMVFLGSSTDNERNLDSATTITTTVVPTESGGSSTHAVYLADAGATGTYSTTLNFNAAIACYALGGIYKIAGAGAASDPAATTTRFTKSRHTFGTRR